MSDQDQVKNSHNLSPSVAVLQLMTGYWAGQVVYVAANLGLADLLKDGLKSSDELAQATRTHAPSLARLLRALAGLGVCVEGEDGRFALTPLGACLQSGAPGSVRASALMFGETLYRTWGSLLQSVQTGEPAFGQVFGMPVYHYERFLKTLDTWREEITNYFLQRHNSGFVERLNNKIKVLKRRCYGIFNLPHLFQRIFLDLEGYRLFARPVG